MSGRITISGRMMAMVMIGAATTALGGCINVSAPDKPIEINLNISVTQEVVYRLDGEAKTLIQQNPGGIF
ncbi:isoaspartyl peptidase/L-asparaginase-like protein (Ntn-hydrolase superfamily) [Sphingomonas insulae]|uniref:YnbE family lipoprotein n=1 Tax=Sphingomonas insulae TaxID=424800 RepID=A0ABP3T177_9SPHN|nr:YnbE family lipoprotein [Sphingomonas insulae]NIJ28710.1 isoaspartyl peptidase/L-asparaginase-like protein (Ntn-hydrolase superfamily) [Sphingomonas insulae]